MMRVLPTTSRVDVMAISTSNSISQVVSEAHMSMAFWNPFWSETLAVVTAKKRWESVSFFEGVGAELWKEFGRFRREKG